MALALVACGGGGVAGPTGPGADLGNGSEPGRDGSGTSDAGADDAFGGPSVCTSGDHWTGGDEESPHMHPGRACIDCHTEEDEGPDFSLAGTIFPTGHEPDDCLGASGRTADITIEVTDADGKVVRMSPNRSGNFLSESNLNFPITARVLYEGRVRAMATPVDEGDCNGCHTESGREGAPGRIALP